MSRPRVTFLYSQKGFLNHSALLYAAVLTAVFILPAFLYLLPGFQSWVYFPAAFILGLISFTLLNRYLKKKMKKEILTLTRAAKKYGKGDFSSPLPSWKNDAVDVLTGTIAQSFQNLHSKIERTENEKEKLSMMLQHMSEGVVGVSQDLRILICNPSAVQILGFEKNPMGKSLIELTHHPEIDGMMRQTLQTLENTSREIVITYPGKKNLKVSAAATGAREGLCGVLVLHDITEIKKLETLRKDFVANVSHELRTPLTSIKGFIEILRSGGMKNPEQADRFLTMMQDDSDRLHRLIEDLLTLSSLESGAAHLNLAGVSISEEISKVLSVLNPQIIKKGIHVSLNIPDNLPEVYADRDKLQQVLINLLDNAVKFNNQNGKITILAKTQNDTVEIAVQDSGSGIPQEAIARVFERFFRVDKARSREEGGTGLGLSIVKHIVEAHGGYVSCESVPGQGSTFRFTLPAA